RESTNGLEVVKVGVSWPASFFGIFWLLRYRLRRFAGLSLSGFMLVAGARESAQSQKLMLWPFAVVWAVIWFAHLIKGNAGREEKLKSQGYELLATVEADPPAGAITRVNFAQSAAAENELRVLAKTSQAPEGFNMVKMLQPPKTKPHISGRNTPWVGY